MSILDVLGNIFDSIGGVLELSDDGKVKLSLKKERREVDDGKICDNHLDSSSKDS